MAPRAAPSSPTGPPERSTRQAIRPARTPTTPTLIDQQHPTSLECPRSRQELPGASCQAMGQNHRRSVTSEGCDRDRRPTVLEYVRHPDGHQRSSSAVVAGPAEAIRWMKSFTQMTASSAECSASTPSAACAYSGCHCSPAAMTGGHYCCRRYSKSRTQVSRICPRFRFSRLSSNWRSMRSRARSLPSADSACSFCAI